MVNCIGRSSDSVVADDKTMADSPILDHTTGRYLRVFFNITTPPASSFLYYQWAGREPVGREHLREPEMLNYFMYRAAAGASSQTASLTEIPTLDHWSCHSRGEELRGGVGILQRSKDEILVVDLRWMCSRKGTAQLRLLRFGRPEWEFMPKLPIIAVDEDGKEDSKTYLDFYHGTSVVPVGDRFLCWFDYCRGFLIYDLVAESQKLWFLPLPKVSNGKHIIGFIPDSQSMCGVGANTVRFVSIDPRWGSSGSGRSTWRAFTVTTWKLSLETNAPLIWFKDTVLDCEELWAHPGYEGLPRVLPKFPIVHSISFNR
ncbi:hypothetical protein QOZ80_9AG0671220 [Eleusine coracana subsp. coracana]|nr:hypothetical protein QOZ80_9AG0671220 [Eleusine coracana subsp. coracana]